MRPCSVQPAILPKPEFTLGLNWRSAENSDVSTGKHPWWKFLFSKNAGLESIPVILLKTNSTTGNIWHGLCKVPLFSISENFLRGITVILLIQDFIPLLKMTEYIVYIELTFSSKDNFNWVADNVYIRMPEPMPIPRCRCWDFQMAFIDLSGTIYFVRLLNGCF